jgi:hypothetical protein
MSLAARAAMQLHLLATASHADAHICVAVWRDLDDLKSQESEYLHSERQCKE